MSTPSGDPLVTVIMIFWNSPTFMDEAIRSVLEQNYTTLELVLCDDGSTDVSTSLAQAWVGLDPDRVRYVEHPAHAHLGMGATRSLGVRHARGELVAFLDADDVWRPDHLEEQVKQLREHPEAAAVCGTALDWHSWQPAEQQDAWSALPGPSGAVLDPPVMMTAVLRHGGYATPICSLLVRRRVLEEGGFDYAFTSMYEDQVMLARLYLQHRIVLSGAQTALYRQHEGSSCAHAIRRGDYHPMHANRSTEAFLRWLEKQPPLKAPSTDPQLTEALQESLKPYATLRRRLSWRFLAVLRRARGATTVFVASVVKRIRGD